MARDRGDDDIERGVLENIENHGCHIWHVEQTADDDGPAFSYSVGLYERLGHPEVIVFGPVMDIRHALINDVMGLVEQGRQFRSGDLSAELWDPYEVGFLEVADATKQEHLTWCEWYYEAADFPALQLVTPDPTGRLPGEAGFDEGYAGRQPLLGEWTTPERSFVPVDRVYAATRDGEPEQLWARLRGDGVYELVSAPFDAYGLNVGDLVGCEPDPATGCLMVRDVEEASGRRTLRIIYNDKTTRIAERNAIQGVLDGMGADIYPLSERYVAVDLPADTDYDAVFGFLASEAEANRLAFEEAWRDEDGETQDIPWV